MFVFPYTFLLFDLVCFIPLSFFSCCPSIHSTQVVVFVQGHIPGLLCQSAAASTPPLHTAHPLPSHLTLSLPLFLCGD